MTTDETIQKKTKEYKGIVQSSKAVLRMFNDYRQWVLAGYVGDDPWSDPKKSSPSQTYCNTLDATHGFMSSRKYFLRACNDARLTQCLHPYTMFLSSHVMSC